MMLLKMTVIFKAEMKIVSSRQANRFCCIVLSPPEPFWRSEALICATGIPTYEIVSRTGVGRRSPGSACADYDSEGSDSRDPESNQM